MCIRDSLYPNWGTEFGINSLSAIDLPFPRRYKTVSYTHLDVYKRQR